jgi:uncharacterized repeat protein (TIGR01451 family)
MMNALWAAAWLLALGCWLAIGTGPLAHAALARSTGPAKKVPVSHGSTKIGPNASVRPPAVPGLSISITDGRTSAVRGDHLRYVVKVKNAGGATARNLRVTLTLPPYLSVSSASQRAAAKAGKVSWRTSLRPGLSASFTITAVVGKTPPGMGHLAVVACADQHKGTPIICAAHLDRLPGAAGTTSHTSGPASPGMAGSAAASSSKTRYLVGGLVIAACVLLAAFAARRIRGRKEPGHARLRRPI